MDFGFGENQTYSCWEGLIWSGLSYQIIWKVFRSNWLSSAWFVRIYPPAKNAFCNERSKETAWTFFRVQRLSPDFPGVKEKRHIMFCWIFKTIYFILLLWIPFSLPGSGITSNTNFIPAVLHYMRNQLYNWNNCRK